MLDISRIRAATDWAEIRYVEEVESTNTALMQGEISHGTVLLTNSQTAGKGRLGRAWTAPAGTQLTFSVALLPESLATVGTLPLAAGLAVTDSVPGSVLKWPNDVLLDGKKLCGILAEAGPVGSFKAAPFKSAEFKSSEFKSGEFKSGEFKSSEFKSNEFKSSEFKSAEFKAGDQDLAPAARVVLGVGINVTAAPLDTATCLADAALPTDRTDLAISVLSNLHRRIRQWHDDDPALLEDYRAVCSSIGQDVRLEAPTGVVTGTVRGVADDGRINVDGDYYSAGDVIHLRPAQS
ncbi:biotin--[acetyl-CoA-carboxylase] ligase [Corynebacterium lizhenjunii]|uniref:biotin--[acetyl-CoA-carboxylase] ligase n=1 Tax=Corynebacterium lizhenjunii TaxID=2709394 RepID=UPI0013EA1EC8|nr:biotin--[acetyl-CoA-carboxylase] ligase [Corynebacterium lizhenjunii]